MVRVQLRRGIVTKALSSTAGQFLPRLHSSLVGVVGHDRIIAEACTVLDAQKCLARIVAALRAQADVKIDEQGKPLALLSQYAGLETAPLEIRQRFEASFCGSHPYPQDSHVEHLWNLMSSAPTADGSALSFGAWSLWRLRALGAGAFQASVDDRGLGDEHVRAFVAEALERWSAFATCLAGGVLGGGVPAADELLREDHWRPSGRRVEIYVTHLTDDDYVLGAAVLAASLAATETTRPLLALITDGVTAEGRQILHDAGWALLDVSLVGFEGIDSVHIRGYFSKIWLWGLPCHSAIYLDTDTVVLENLDGLFSTVEGKELAAAQDSQPDMDGDMIVQAGLMVVEPSPRRFADLWEVCCGSRRQESLDVWKQHEQGFLSLYFDGDRGAAACGPGEPRPKWQILPPKYNLTVRYHLRPLYTGLRPSNTAVVHFACCKPWDPKQRHFAPPAYVQMFLELARAIGVPWRPGVCAMDEEREKEQQRKLEQVLGQQHWRT